MRDILPENFRRIAGEFPENCRRIVGYSAGELSDILPENRRIMLRRYSRPPLPREWSLRTYRRSTLRSRRVATASPIIVIYTSAPPTGVLGYSGCACFRSPMGSFRSIREPQGSAPRESCAWHRVTRPHCLRRFPMGPLELSKLGTEPRCGRRRRGR